MAGHSQFKNIMYRKGAQDNKRAKLFTKIIRELTVSAKTGSADPEINARLRNAILNARTANMPKDNIERAIKRGAGGEDDTDYQEIVYEGYGPAGIALIVEALTDNRNRTAPEVRSAFNKNGGALGEAGSVSFQFNHVGCISYASSAFSYEQIFEAALEAGAEEVGEEEDEIHVYCHADAFHSTRDALISALGDPLRAERIWKPKSLITVDDHTAQTLFKLVETLEDNDDVQRVFGNYHISESALKDLAS